MPDFRTDRQKSNPTTLLAAAIMIILGMATTVTAFAQNETADTLAQAPEKSAVTNVEPPDPAALRLR